MWKRDVKNLERVFLLRRETLFAVYQTTESTSICRFSESLELEEETKAQLAEVQAEVEKLCRRGNYTPKENFHLTLHFLGEVIRGQPIR